MRAKNTLKSVVAEIQGGLERREVVLGNWLSKEQQIIRERREELRKGGVVVRYPSWKRTLDLTCVLISCPVWLPLMVLLAVWIKLVSRGPIIFTFEKIGMGFEKFPMFKFRTMKASFEYQAPPLSLSGNDPRLIPLGRFLRATGLDELPQIFNIIRGEMSLVGPRPMSESDLTYYRDMLLKRAASPPGITGQWQLSGKTRATFHEMLELDVKYAEHMSFWNDLKIIVKTPIAVIRGLWKSETSFAGKSGKQSKKDDDETHSGDGIRTFIPWGHHGAT